MRPQALLAVLAVVAVLAAALPLAHSQDTTLCCDKCGICTRSFPPQCRCMDISPTGCNPACKTCAKSTVGGRDSFQCKDFITNFCKTRCTKAA
ncbi:unnamed protein product [Triticum turgidum subsp. durum]|uniref:Bowman-Birk serine protease inhibitors family domain-containing protein n=1 Tax=Triticum turgidum subsp. durum TaxID=4567 RepID=A0A9R0QIV8_TRITD|nr:unnamed protein product [Triticum turgidum subsp. durum]